MASGATLSLTRNCYVVDAKTKAAVAVLLKHDAVADKSDVARDRRIDLLEQTVAALLASRDEPAAGDVDHKIAALVEIGDAKGAAKLVAEKAARIDATGREAQRRAAALYERQAYLLAGISPTEALAAMDKAIAADPSNRQPLWDASILAQDLGDQARQLAYYDQLSTLIDQKLSRTPADFDLLYETGLISSARGHALAELHRSADALSAYGTAIVVWQNLAKVDTNNDDLKRDIADVNVSIGNSLFALNDLSGARAAYDNTISIMTPIAKKHPDDETWLRELALGYAGLASVAENRHDIKNAIIDFEIAKKLLSEDHDDEELASIAFYDEDLKMILAGLHRLGIRPDQP